PLISKLLAVPSLRTKYLGYIHKIAQDSLDWNKIGPVAQDYQQLIAADIKTDTRKLDPTEDFEKNVTENVGGRGGPGGGGRGGPGGGGPNGGGANAGPGGGGPGGGGPGGGGPGGPGFGGRETIGLKPFVEQR